LQAIETSSFHKENMIHLRSAQQENLPDILSTFSGSGNQFQSFRFSGLSILPSLPLWNSGDLGSNLLLLEFRDCEIGEKDLVGILGQMAQLKSLALVNCRETFMSGNFLANGGEAAVLRRSLAGLRSLCLDSNKYLSDVLLMRISEATPKLEHLRLELIMVQWGCAVLFSRMLRIIRYSPTSIHFFLFKRNSSAWFLTIRSTLKVSILRR